LTSIVYSQILSLHHAKPIPPNIVESGFCQENILRGDEVDFDKLPVPLLHQGDGGRYIQTYGIHVVRSPDEKWTSWSINRAMVLGKNKLAGLLPPSQHISLVHKMWTAQGKDTPWACVFGAPPAAIALGGTPLPEGASEDEYVGAMAGMPVDIVKCKTNDLYVPANAEIVLEGTISQTEKAIEGAMGEYHGFVFPDDKKPQPVFTVNAITYRNKAILPISVAGKAADETVRLRDFSTPFVL
jgi:UbiD family decarboxylase